MGLPSYTTESNEDLKTIHPETPEIDELFSLILDCVWMIMRNLKNLIPNCYW